jgi:hypothetical protein
MFLEEINKKYEESLENNKILSNPTGGIRRSKN